MPHTSAANSTLTHTVPVHIGVNAVDEFADLNAGFEDASPTSIIEWAIAGYERLVVTTSFSDLILVDHAVAVDPDIEVLFLDTGFHFQETLDTMAYARDRYGLNLTVLAPPADAVELFTAGTEACCDARKVRPLNEYLTSSADAWMSGLRRDDSPLRASAPIIGRDSRGLVKVNPLANMTEADVERYAAERDLPFNPLRDRGYASIGCAPCTVPAADRSGRWSGTEKTECGLHR